MQAQATIIPNPYPGGHRRAVTLPEGIFIIPDDNEPALQPGRLVTVRYEPLDQFATIIAAAPEAEQGTQYKVWLQIEEIDEAHDHYETIHEVDLGDFPSLDEAKAFHARVEALAVTPPASNHYTVLLLYPDYLTSNYGRETYMTSVDAATPEEAIQKAQREVSENSVEATRDPEDFHHLMVIAGEHQDVKP